MAVTYRKRRKAKIIFVIILLTLAILNIPNILQHFFPYHHRDIIEKYAAQQNIDPLLLAAIIKRESNFNPRARSEKGARGLMQIMPETGTWIAGQMEIESFHPDELYEVDTNIRFGAWYMAHLLKQFEGELLPALAAYNGGQGNVRKWLSEKNWNENQLTASDIPFPETRNYVTRVLRTYKIYRYLYS